MKITEQNSLSPQQRPQVMQLWNKEYPEKLSYQTEEQFIQYLEGLAQQRHYLLSDDAGGLQGWAITFERESELWFAIILDSEVHGKGMGSMLLHHLKQHHEVLNGWVIDHDRDRRPDGRPYPSPLDFYLKNGFEPVPDTRLELEKISAVKIVWRA